MIFSGVFYINTTKHSVSFSVNNHGLIQVNTEDQSVFEIQLQKTQPDLIGDPKTTVQLSWRQDKDALVLLCQDAALLDHLLDLNLPSDVHQHISELHQLRAQRTKGEKHRVSVYLSSIAGFFIALYFAIHFAVPLVTHMIPQAWEKEIGEFAFDHYLAGAKEITHKEVHSAMQSIMQRIDEHDGSNLDYEVAVVEEDRVNAFAFPGGFIIVTSALLEQSEQAEEVAAVLAHEVTHVIERHGMRKLVRKAGMGILLGIVMGDASVLSQLIELSYHLDELAFDRSQETHADAGGVKILQAAGISPKHLVTFFDKIKQLDKVSDNVPAIFLTHPLTDERMQSVADAEEPTRINPLDVNWEEIQKILESESVMP